MRNLLSIRDLDRVRIEELCSLADEFLAVMRRPIPQVPALRGITVATMFFEPSTRTRLSFERAARGLSADVMGFQAAGSSVAKGESLKDTALTLRAMGANIMVVRHGSAGAPKRVAEWTGCPTVNAGDGANQHPTQALADTFALLRRFGRLDGIRIAIVGDVRHSRVARSDVEAFTRMGASVTLVAPPPLLPPDLTGWPVAVSDQLDDLLEELDVVYLLRVQTERGGATVLPSVEEYARRFGLDAHRLGRMPDHAVVMHPGPMNRGVEITPDVADHPRCLVLDQVEAGVAVRMAVLFRLGAGLKGEAPHG
ncbi:MAG: aspartate carbamoyltransferase [Acidimicrobiia bacterium]|nr:MAG: aspartate carbamoyltransferase [Acidimicrobiia bacterium]